MNTPTTEQIKAILTGAPDGATHIDDDGDYVLMEPDCTGISYWGRKTWKIAIDNAACSGDLIRLSDLREILALRERVNELEQQVGDHFKYGYGFCRANGFLYQDQLDDAAKEYIRRTQPPKGASDE